MSWLRQRSAIFVGLVCWLAGLTQIHAAAALPPSPTPFYVLDEAKWLSPNAFDALNEKLKAYERESSSQIVVAIFPKIPDGEELFDFSQRLFGSWKIGQKGKDNGALFLIFAAERKMRIHTGYGLEGVLPDARCKQIIQDVVAPLLRQGNRESAINAGIDSMIASAKGEYTGTGKTQLDNSGRHNPDSIGIWVVVFIIAFIAINIVRGFTRGGQDRRLRLPGDTWIDHSGWGGGGWGGGSSGGGGGGFSGGGGSSGGGGASGGW